MNPKPTIAGFLSYVHEDDEFENGRISRLRERLERAIRFYSGLREFHIFQDWQSIEWGQRWEKVIADSIENSVVLFPIVTPLYFSSEACRNELFAFEKRQTKVGRDNLILPVYYLLSEVMSAPDEELAGSEEARAAKLIKQTQFADWRALRKTEETDRAYAEAIERLAQRAIPALKLGLTANVSPENRTQASPRRAARTAATKRTGRSHSASGRPAPTPHAEASEASTPAVPDHTLAGEVPKEKASPGYVATVTVDQMPGRADFETISEAIARAAVGARIRIRPGHYREQLVINKPLELVGDGPREDIIVDADDGCTLIFDTNIGVVRGLTLKQSGDKEFFAIWIKQGRLALEDCDLSGGNMSCLAVSNNADPRVRRNRIHNAKQAGIFVFAQGRGTYEDNELFGNELSGFSAKEAEPIVRRNRIHENKAAGIYIYENGSGSYEDNEIFGNGTCGFSASREANPIVRRNRIHENKQSGIYTFESGRGTYEDNEVFGNGYSGMEVREDSEPVARRNRIHENKQSGVRAYENGRGTYEDNDIFSNGHAGVRVQSGAAPLMRGNRINKNGYEAIWVSDAGAGIYEDNDLRENTRGPWDIEASASAELKRTQNIEN